MLHIMPERLDDLAGVVYDVVKKREDEGSDALPTFEELASRPQRESNWWLERAAEAHEQGNQGAAAFANMSAMERYERAQRIIEHQPANCRTCGEELTLPHEWVIGLHVNCFVPSEA